MKHYVLRTIKCFNEEIRFEFLSKNSRFRARSDLIGQFLPYFRCTVLDGSLSTLQVGNWRNIKLEIVVIGFEGLIWLTLSRDLAGITSLNQVEFLSYSFKITQIVHFEIAVFIPQKVESKQSVRLRSELNAILYSLVPQVLLSLVMN